MIIDSHGHYTTLPPAVDAWRSRQIADLAKPTKGSINVSDDEIRETLENGQIKRETSRTRRTAMAGIVKIRRARTTVRGQVSHFMNKARQTATVGIVETVRAAISENLWAWW